MKYPLHTTGDTLLVPEYVQEPKRNALWVHVYSDEDRERTIATIEAAGGWDVLNHGLPCFFVVAVRTHVPPELRDWLVAMITPHQRAGDIRLLGWFFGYDPDEIDWYIQAVHAT